MFYGFQLAIEEVSCSSPVVEVISHVSMNETYNLTSCRLDDLLMSRSAPASWRDKLDTVVMHDFCTSDSKSALMLSIKSSSSGIVQGKRVLARWRFGSIFDRHICSGCTMCFMICQEVPWLNSTMKTSIVPSTLCTYDTSSGLPRVRRTGQFPAIKCLPPFFFLQFWYYN